MDVNETSFAFRLNYSLQHGKKRNFGKSNEVILYENWKTSKILQSKLSEDGFRSTTFLDWFKFSKLPKS